MRLNMPGLALVATLLGPGPLGAAPPHSPLSDQQLKSLIEHELEEKDILSVQVSVAGGHVTLKGAVKSAWARAKAVEIASEVHDVKSVLSELTVARGESDRSVAEDVARRVRKYVFFTIFDDVSVAVDQGTVTLTGRVTAPHKVEEIARLASRVPGVQEVRNEVKALPASIFDDQLRNAIASGIYNDPIFWNYALDPDPSIHIIVESSRVTLTGVVSTELEKRKAEIIARSVFGVLGVENRLRIE